MTIRARLLIAGVAAASLATSQSLSYEVFKSKVQPIFLKKRPDHARCVVCHANATNSFKLQPLAPGATTWTEEQTRMNFETVSKLVNPNNLLASPLLKHPLVHEAGGDEFHSGGRQFASQSDPDWKAMADWAKGAK